MHNEQQVALHLHQSRKKTDHTSFHKDVKELVNMIGSSEGELNWKTEHTLRDVFYFLGIAQQNVEIVDLLKLLRILLRSRPIFEALLNSTTKDKWLNMLVEPMINTSPQVVKMNMFVLFNVVETGFMVEKGHFNIIETELANKNAFTELNGQTAVIKNAIKWSQTGRHDDILELGLGLFISIFCHRTWSTSYTSMLATAQIIEKTSQFLLLLTRPYIFGPIISEDDDIGQLGFKLTHSDEQKSKSLLAKIGRYVLDSRRYTIRVLAMTILRHFVFFSQPNVVRQLQTEALASGALLWLFLISTSPAVVNEPIQSIQNDKVSSGSDEQQNKQPNDQNQQQHNILPLSAALHIRDCARDLFFLLLPPTGISFFFEHLLPANLYEPTLLPGAAAHPAQSNRVCLADFGGSNDIGRCPLRPSVIAHGKNELWHDEDAKGDERAEFDNFLSYMMSKKDMTALPPAAQERGNSYPPPFPLISPVDLQYRSPVQQNTQPISNITQTTAIYQPPPSSDLWHEPLYLLTPFVLPPRSKWAMASPYFYYYDMSPGAFVHNRGQGTYGGSKSLNSVVAQEYSLSALNKGSYEVQNNWRTKLRVGDMNQSMIGIESLKTLDGQRGSWSSSSWWGGLNDVSSSQMQNISEGQYKDQSQGNSIDKKKTNAITLLNPQEDRKRSIGWDILTEEEKKKERSSSIHALYERSEGIVATSRIIGISWYDLQRQHNWERQERKKLNASANGLTERDNNGIVTHGYINLDGSNRAINDVSYLEENQIVIKMKKKADIQHRPFTIPVTASLAASFFSSTSLYKQLLYEVPNEYEEQEATVKQIESGEADWGKSKLHQFGEGDLYGESVTLRLKHSSNAVLYTNAETILEDAAVHKERAKRRRRQAGSNKGLGNQDKEDDDYFSDDRSRNEQGSIKVSVNLRKFFDDYLLVRLEKERQNDEVIMTIDTDSDEDEYSLSESNEFDIDELLKQDEQDQKQQNTDKDIERKIILSSRALGRWKQRRNRIKLGIVEDGEKFKAIRRASDLMSKDKLIEGLEIDNLAIQKGDRNELKHEIRRLSEIRRKLYSLDSNPLSPSLQQLQQPPLQLSSSSCPYFPINAGAFWAVYDSNFFSPALVWGDQERNELIMHVTKEMIIFANKGGGWDDGSGLWRNQLTSQMFQNQTSQTTQESDLNFAGSFPAQTTFTFSSPSVPLPSAQIIAYNSHLPVFAPTVRSTTNGYYTMQFQSTFPTQTSSFTHLQYKSMDDHIFIGGFYADLLLCEYEPVLYMRPLESLDHDNRIDYLCYKQDDRDNQLQQQQQQQIQSQEIKLPVMDAGDDCSRFAVYLFALSDPVNFIKELQQRIQLESSSLEAIIEFTSAFVQIISFYYSQSQTGNQPRTIFSKATVQSNQSFSPLLPAFIQFSIKIRQSLVTIVILIRLLVAIIRLYPHARQAVNIEQLLRIEYDCVASATSLIQSISEIFSQSPSTGNSKASEKYQFPFLFQPLQIDYYSETKKFTGQGSNANAFILSEKSIQFNQLTFTLGVAKILLAFIIKIASGGLSALHTLIRTSSRRLNIFIQQGGVQLLPSLFSLIPTVVLLLGVKQQGNNKIRQDNISDISSALISANSQIPQAIISRFEIVHPLYNLGNDSSSCKLYLKSLLSTPIALKEALQLIQGLGQTLTILHTRPNFPISIGRRHCYAKNILRARRARKEICFRRRAILEEKYQIEAKINKMKAEDRTLQQNSIQGDKTLQRLIYGCTSVDLKKKEQKQRLDITNPEVQKQLISPKGQSLCFELGLQQRHQRQIREKELQFLRQQVEDSAEKDGKINIPVSTILSLPCDIFPSKKRNEMIWGRLDQKENNINEIEMKKQASSSQNILQLIKRKDKRYNKIQLKSKNVKIGIQSEVGKLEAMVEQLNCGEVCSACFLMNHLHNLEEEEKKLNKQSLNKSTLGSFDKTWKVTIEEDLEQFENENMYGVLYFDEEDECEQRSSARKQAIETIRSKHRQDMIEWSRNKTKQKESRKNRPEIVVLAEKILLNDKLLVDNQINLLQTDNLNFINTAGPEMMGVNINKEDQEVDDEINFNEQRLGQDKYVDNWHVDKSQQTQKFSGESAQEEGQSTTSVNASNVKNQQALLNVEDEYQYSYGESSEDEVATEKNNTNQYQTDLELLQRNNSYEEQLQQNQQEWSQQTPYSTTSNQFIKPTQFRTSIRGLASLGKGIQIMPTSYPQTQQLPHSFLSQQTTQQSIISLLDYDDNDDDLYPQQGRSQASHQSPVKGQQFNVQTSTSALYETQGERNQMQNNQANTQQIQDFNLNNSATGEIQQQQQLVGDRSDSQSWGYWGESGRGGRGAMVNALFLQYPLSFDTQIGSQQIIYPIARARIEQEEIEMEKQILTEELEQKAQQAKNRQEKENNSGENIQQWVPDRDAVSFSLYALDIASGLLKVSPQTWGAWGDFRSIKNDFIQERLLRDRKLNSDGENSPNLPPPFMLNLIGRCLLTPSLSIRNFAARLILEMFYADKYIDPSLRAQNQAERACLEPFIMFALRYGSGRIQNRLVQQKGNEVGSFQGSEIIALLKYLVVLAIIHFKEEEKQVQLINLKQQNNSKSEDKFSRILNSILPQTIGASRLPTSSTQLTDSHTEQSLSFIHFPFVPTLQLSSQSLTSFSPLLIHAQKYFSRMQLGGIESFRNDRQSQQQKIKDIKQTSFSYISPATALSLSFQQQSFDFTVFLQSFLSPESQDNSNQTYQQHQDDQIKPVSFILSSLPPSLVSLLFTCQLHLSNDLLENQAKIVNKGNQISQNFYDQPQSSNQIYPSALFDNNQFTSNNNVQKILRLFSGLLSPFQTQFDLGYKKYNQMKMNKIDPDQSLEDENDPDRLWTAKSHSQLVKIIDQFYISFFTRWSKVPIIDFISIIDIDSNNEDETQNNMKQQVLLFKGQENNQSKVNELARTQLMQVIGQIQKNESKKQAGNQTIQQYKQLKIYHQPLCVINFTDSFPLSADLCTDGGGLAKGVNSFFNQLIKADNQNLKTDWFEISIPPPRIFAPFIYPSFPCDQSSLSISQNTTLAQYQQLKFLNNLQRSALSLLQSSIIQNFSLYSTRRAITIQTTDWSKRRRERRMNKDEQAYLEERRNLQKEIDQIEKRNKDSKELTNLQYNLAQVDRQYDIIKQIRMNKEFDRNTEIANQQQRLLASREQKKNWRVRHAILDTTAKLIVLLTDIKYNLSQPREPLFDTEVTSEIEKDMREYFKFRTDFTQATTLMNQLTLLICAHPRQFQLIQLEMKNDPEQNVKYSALQILYPIQLLIRFICHWEILNEQFQSMFMNEEIRKRFPGVEMNFWYFPLFLPALLSYISTLISLNLSNIYDPVAAGRFITDVDKLNNQSSTQGNNNNQNIDQISSVRKGNIVIEFISYGGMKLIYYVFKTIILPLLINFIKNQINQYQNIAQEKLTQQKLQLNRENVQQTSKFNRIYLTGLSTSLQHSLAIALVCIQCEKKFKKMSVLNRQPHSLEDSDSENESQIPGNSNLTKQKAKNQEGTSIDKQLKRTSVNFYNQFKIDPFEIQNAKKKMEQKNTGENQESATAQTPSAPHDDLPSFNWSSDPKQPQTQIGGVIPAQLSSKSIGRLPPPQAPPPPRLIPEGQSQSSMKSDQGANKPNQPKILLDKKGQFVLTQIDEVDESSFHKEEELQYDDATPPLPEKEIKILQTPSPIADEIEEEQEEQQQKIENTVNNISRSKFIPSFQPRQQQKKANQSEAQLLVMMASEAITEITPAVSFVVMNSGKKANNFDPYIIHLLHLSLSALYSAFDQIFIQRSGSRLERDEALLAVKSLQSCDAIHALTFISLHLPISIPTPFYAILPSLNKQNVDSNADLYDKINSERIAPIRVRNYGDSSIGTSLALQAVERVEAFHTALWTKSNAELVTYEAIYCLYHAINADPSVVQIPTKKQKGDTLKGKMFGTTAAAAQQADDLLIPQFLANALTNQNKVVSEEQIMLFAVWRAYTDEQDFNKKLQILSAGKKKLGDWVSGRKRDDGNDAPLDRCQLFKEAQPFGGHLQMMHMHSLSELISNLKLKREARRSKKEQRRRLKKGQIVSLKLGPSIQDEEDLAEEGKDQEKEKSDAVLVLEEIAMQIEKNTQIEQKLIVE